MSVKRCIDIVGAIGGIVVRPIDAYGALAIKLRFLGPYCSRQERYGLNKRRFRMYKFRTMVLDAEM